MTENIQPPEIPNTPREQVVQTFQKFIAKGFTHPDDLPLNDPEVAIFYRELVKQARKRNVGVVSVTQDAEDFLHNEYGKAIITNSETKILLKQSYAALSEIGTIYPMTDEERQQLGHLEVGEVFLFREGEHIRLNVAVLPFEKPLVFTNLE